MTNRTFMVVVAAWLGTLGCWGEGTESPSSAFVRAARVKYAEPCYQSYTNSIVGEFLGKKGDVLDVPREGDLVGWVRVPGVRNVRDLGGWNGLRTGRVYRGSELNAVGKHGLALQPEGKKIMRERLGIRSDLDFRAVNIKERAENMTESALGADVQLLDHPIGNYLNMFSQPRQYAAALRVFAHPENYPIYMHCWGGADRTGTIAFILEGLCGVTETDLAIDYELTSFSIFGKRLRHDHSHYLYASMLAKLKTYSGRTLQEKFATYARETLGLTDGEIAAIRAQLTK